MSKLMIAEPANNVFEIPCAMIVADPKQNTRKQLTGIAELASSIKNAAESVGGAEGKKKPVMGQQSPVLVAKREDGKFDLIYGFRRFAALSWSKDKGGLESETIMARVVEAMEPEERLLTNLVENMAREDLSTYDTAMACKSLEDMTKGTKKPLSGASIANKVGKSAPYVNNLLRAVRNLPPNIMIRWKQENGENWEEEGKGAKAVLTPDNLNKLAKESLTDEERQILFRKLKGEDVGGGGSGSGAGSGNRNTDITKRASKAELEKALEAAKEMLKKKKSEAIKACIVTLKFALGETEGIKGVYEPEDDKDDAN